MEGFYAMYYTGLAGFGHAVFILSQGIVTGADAIGGVLDGTYSTTGGGDVDITVTLTVPVGSTLVTGQVALTGPLTQKITAKLRNTFADGQPVQIHTELGPVNVIFKKLRGLV